MDYLLDSSEGEGERMESNFAFLKKEFLVLANFGELAEKYCYSDSNSCLMKLGMIGETIVMMKPEAELSAVAIDYVLCDEEPYIRKIALKM